tara:strand:+ start:278 stop:568 length:291 start_codon:yes stop_codon:yes gene_type:complete
MKNTILFDVEEYLENAYPNLTDSDIDLIARDVSMRWDYASLTNDVDDQIRQTAYYANIELRPPFNTESVALVSDNEVDSFDDEIEYEPMEHTSEGC